MGDLVFKKATIKDIPFLVDTIIEAEKSGTEILTYTTIFGLSEEVTRNYLSQMLLEEIDGCELSISSFLLAFSENQIAAAIAAWVEGSQGISSNILKGNLLNYFLPKSCIEQARIVNSLTSDLHIEYLADTIQIGLVYVSQAFRGLGLASLLIEEQINRLTANRKQISKVYVQVFGNNTRAIRAYQKAKFSIQFTKESINPQILNYMPSSKKILMLREITKKTT
jgi:ribosomal protein S18 acetylase RimI-like enzyme